MKTVLILTNSAGGLFNFRGELVKELVSNGYKVYFTGPETVENDKRVKGLIDFGATYLRTPVDRRGINPIKDFALLKNYYKIFKRVKPDIVLTYTIKPNIYGSIISKLFDKPLIMNITGMGTSLTRGKLKFLLEKLYTLACLNANAVYFQNAHNKSIFLKKNMVKESKTRLIPGSGVNLDKFDYRPRLESDNIKFLFIGRIMKEKGFGEYISAALEINSKYENTEFFVVGRFEESYYEEFLKNINSSRINFLGYSMDIREQIESVDCIINPSYHEGMSNVLLEAASIGRPVIASKIPGCEETFQEGISGFGFEVKNKDSLIEVIEKFLGLSKEEKYLMGKAGRKKMEREFNRIEIVNMYLKEIKNIIENKF